MNSSLKKFLATIKKRFPTLWQFAGFSIVGTSGLAIMLVTYYVCIWLGLSKQIANFAGFFTSTAYSYLLNFVFVFNTKGVKHKGAAVKFFVLYLILYFFSAFLIYLVVDVLHISELIAPLINSVIITPPSFLGSKYWVFKEKKPAYEKPL